MALSQAVLSGDDATNGAPPALSVNEPIAKVDGRFLAAGWRPQPAQNPLPFERRLAGNSLDSLSSCSGTGLGLCRYDYRRGNDALAVVTVPGANGEGLVHSWFHPDLSPARIPRSGDF